MLEKLPSTIECNMYKQPPENKLQIQVKCIGFSKLQALGKPSRNIYVYTVCNRAFRVLFLLETVESFKFLLQFNYLYSIFYSRNMSSKEMLNEKIFHRGIKQSGKILLCQCMGSLDQHKVIKLCFIFKNQSVLGVLIFLSYFKKILKYNYIYTSCIQIFFVVFLFFLLFFR